MSKSISEHAHVAKLIRQELKKHGVKGRVSAKSYSGGSSVRVELDNPLAATAALVSKFCDRFQMGDFNGMEDIYEYRKDDDDLPKVKFVFVQANYSEERKQAAWDYLRATMGGFEEAPESYKDAHTLRVHNDWGDRWISRLLNDAKEHFWTTQKPRLAA